MIQVRMEWTTMVLIAVLLLDPTMGLLMQQLEVTEQPTANNTLVIADNSLLSLFANTLLSLRVP